LKIVESKNWYHQKVIKSFPMNGYVTVLIFSGQFLCPVLGDRSLTSSVLKELAHPALHKFAVYTSNIFLRYKLLKTKTCLIFFNRLLEQFNFT
jgi:lipid-A-disaccharide synthase-like uncharacterized protein